MNLLRTLINGWLIAVALDGVIRILSGLVQAAFGIPALGIVILPVELVAVFGGLVAWFIAAASSQIPKRILLPPMIAIVWMMAGALPFSVLWFNGPGMQISVGVVLLLSVAASEALARSAGHGRWGLQAEPLGDKADFQWRSALGWVGGWVVLAPVSLVVYAVIGSAWALSYSTHGFLTLTPQGVAASHKTYTNGDDTVDLIAMIHLGEQEGYQRLFTEIPREGTLVLTEGVKDTDGLISAPQDAYARAANVVGLTVQKPIDELSDLETRNADVDVNTFDPVSIELLNSALGMYAAGDDLNKALTDYLGFWSNHRTDANQVMDQLWVDLLDSRNKRVLDELETARPDYQRIVLPWGALHMVGISESMEADGWTWTNTNKVVLIRWSTLLGR